MELSFSAGLGLEKPNSDCDRGETFFPNSGSDLDSDETFQISRNLGLDIDEIVCLLDSQLCLQYRHSCRLPDSQSQRVIFRLRISLRI
jgi:hypothetical protein